MKKMIKVLYFALCFALLLVPCCNAYIDPSVATFALSAISAVLVAVGATVSILWRRTKKKVQDKLGIDENSKKEVEDDIEFEDED